MSKIILPAPAAENRPLACFDFLGMINIGNRSVSLNRIESVELAAPENLLVTMASGETLTFANDEAKAFLAKLTELADIVTSQARQQIVQVPPGAQLRQH